jgi:Mce-associated membrane protein
VNFHDLLGVSPDAGPDEIRSAWQAKVADVDPSDWRFAAYNEALTELLKQHAAAEPEPEPEPEAVVAEATSLTPAPLAPQPTGDEQFQMPAAATRAPRVVPLWLLAALAVLAAACVAVAGVAWSKPSPRGIEDQARAAQSAAESAATAILSYDYRTLSQDEQSAESTMTSQYRDKKYAPYFKVVQQNAPGLQAVVNATVVSSSIVRAGDGRAQILVLFDQSTSNKANATPLVNQNHATFTMEKDGGDWLVSNITT